MHVAKAQTLTAGFRPYSCVFTVVKTACKTDWSAVARTCVIESKSLCLRGVKLVVGTSPHSRKANLITVQYGHAHTNKSARKCIRVTLPLLDGLAGGA